MTVTVPLSSLPFRYSLYLTATPTTGTGAPPPIEIIVASPHYDLALSVTPISVTLKPGGSTRLDVTVTSADYFRGAVYLIPSALTGKLVSAPSNVQLDFGNTAYASIALSIDESTRPGVYIISVQVQGYYCLGSRQSCAILPNSTPVSHVTAVALYVLAPAPQQAAPKTILGLQPRLYFGIIGALALILLITTVVESRRPKRRSSLLAS